MLDKLPPVRGDITYNADIAKGTWFRVGGTADALFKPADEKDLADFLATCPSDIPITILGLGSNVIIRDGGIRGVVIKLGKNFAEIDHDGDIITVGAGATDAVVARYGADNGLGGLEFLIGIPGNIGGALRMNAGAYGAEIADVLIDCRVMDRNGFIHTHNVKDMNMTYRHCGLPDDVIFLSARFRTMADDPNLIHARLNEIKKQREDTQPVKDRTGGSTFANPDGHKAWELIDAVGGRGLQIGGAKVSEKHCNFLINTGDATASDLECLGEELRNRVKDKFNITLQWEIRRIGELEGDFDTRGCA
jgi:UDP-N-acetylmuramate dehydrogenase